MILRHALGLPIGDLRRESTASGVMMIPIPRAGILEEIRGQDRAAVPYGSGVKLRRHDFLGGLIHEYEAVA